MACPLCGSERRTIWLARVPLFGTTEASRFDVVHCDQCTLLFTSPPPTEEELRSLYGEAYKWRPTGGFVNTVEKWYRQLLIRWDQLRAVRLAARLANGEHVLDVGCGDGLLLAEARRSGLQAFGLDQPGAPLWPGCDPAWRQTGDIESATQPAQSWDVVSLFHVAEHLRDPLRVFTKIHGWLKENGVLVLQVPNAGSLQARLLGWRWYAFDVPRHLVHWTEPTLRQALQLTHFRIVAVRYISWRDNGAFLMASLFPQMAPLVERAQDHARHRRRHPIVTAIRRALFLAGIWASTPLVQLEALLRRPAVLTVFAQKAPATPAAESSTDGDAINLRR